MPSWRSSTSGVSDGPLISRLALLTVGLVAAAGALTACGDDGDVAGGSASSQDTVTIQHIHGSTEITDEPERVVALSSVDADTATALGATPLLVPQAPGTDPGELAPWFAESAGGDDVDIINVAGGDQGGEIPFERIAAVQPDVILGMGSGIDAQDYRTLSEIAPTVAPEIGDLGSA